MAKNILFYIFSLLLFNTAQAQNNNRTDLTANGLNQASYVVYDECITNSSSVFKISGIYTNRELYGVELESDVLSEPQYLSTLF